MTDRLQGTNLAALHQAIVEVSAAAFPGVHFEFYREDRTSLPFGDGLAGHDPMAYALLDLAEFEPGDTADPGTGQQAMIAKFEAEIVMKSLPADARLSVRALAAAFAAFIRKQVRFRPDLVFQGQARVAGCYKSDFSPELDQYEVWRVEWMQEVWLGQGTIWMPDPSIPAPPNQVLFSFVPVVGTAYEPEYKDITGLPRVTP